MKLFATYTEAATAISTPQVVTIGNFDGVHVGHQALLRAARLEADRMGLELAVLTFDPHPSAVLNPESARQNLVNAERKQALLADALVDTAVFQHFNASFAIITAEFFASEILVNTLRAKTIIVGADFRFGRNREADIDTLKSLGDRLGFAVLAEPLISTDTSAAVSSSRIRTLLSQGDVQEAAKLLGRRHEVSGLVASDRHLGTAMGFPTINLTDIDVMVPRNGIYAAYAKIDETCHRAAVYVGRRPTQNAGFSIEAHLLDFNGDLYGRRVTLYFVQRVRGDMKFEDTNTLIAQIAQDVRTVRQLLEQAP